MRASEPDDAAGVDPEPEVDEGGTAVASTTLDPALHSVARARSLVARVCSRAGTPPGTADDAALVVSELVTNAVLHARTEVTVAVRAAAGTVVVEVADGSRQVVQPPELRAVPTGPVDVFEEVGLDDPIASLPTTGRGIELVSALARRWGVVDGPDGKTVWAEVGDDATGAWMSLTSEVPPPPPQPAPPPERPLVEVHIVAVPLRLVAESDHQFDDSLRELQVMAMSGDGPPQMRDLAERAGALSDRLRAVQLSHTTEVRAARERGDRLADVVLPATPSVPSDVDELASLLAEMHRARHQGWLLAPGPSDEVLAFRRWFAAEVVGQLAGSRPRPCPFPVVPAGAERSDPRPLNERRRQLLERFDADIAEAPDVDAVVVSAVRRIATDLQAAFVNLLLVEPDGTHVNSVDRIGYQPDEPHGRRYPLTDDNPICEVVRTATPIVCRTPEERRDRYPGLVLSEPVRANPTGVWVPIGSTAPAAGTIVVGFNRARDFTAGDLELLVEIGRALHRRLEALTPPS